MSTRPKIIGLVGHAGSGKDTARHILCTHHRYYGMALADPIRGMLAALLKSANVDLGWINIRSRKERPITDLGDDFPASYRQMAQTLGTEWGRSLHHDLWLRIGQRRVDGLRDSGRHSIVVSDIRFQNEADWITGMGGEIWRIVRPGLQRVREHVSEAGADSIEADRVIVNSGDIDQLAIELHLALHPRRTDSSEACT